MVKNDYVHTKAMCLSVTLTDFALSNAGRLIKVLIGEPLRAKRLQSERIL